MNPTVVVQGLIDGHHLQEGDHIDQALALIDDLRSASGAVRKHHSETLLRSAELIEERISELGASPVSDICVRLLCAIRGQDALNIVRAEVASSVARLKAEGSHLWTLLDVLSDQSALAGSSRLVGGTGPIEIGRNLDIAEKTLQEAGIFIPW